MKEESLKARIAKGVIKVAKENAFRTVGKSIPLGMHEVEVPEELKRCIKSYAEDK